MMELIGIGIGLAVDAYLCVELAAKIYGCRIIDQWKKSKIGPYRAFETLSKLRRLPLSGSYADEHISRIEEHLLAERLSRGHSTNSSLC